MLFIAAALFTGAAVSASAISSSTVFKVRDFSADCIPHSSQCRVIQPGTMETWKHAVQCVALVQSNGGFLPNVKEATCKDSSRTFDVAHHHNGLTFTVSQPVTPSSNQTGSHFITPKELTVSKQPNAMVQSYKGPRRFDLTE